MSNNHAKPSTKRQPRGVPKGRQTVNDDVLAINTVLANVPLSRETLIEHLHTLNDHFGYLSAGHIAALAQVMGLAQIDVYETASFYSHFALPLDGEVPPHDVTLRICDGPACRMAGAKELLKDALNAFSDQVNVIPAPCQGACDTPPSAIVGKRRVASANVAALKAQITHADTAPIEKILAPQDPGPIDLNDAITTLERAGLRGLGGAGFPTAKKWAFFKNAPDNRVLVVNADEGEPGTFKDRYLLENHLGQVLDGLLIAARALAVTDAFIYLRDEYAHLHAALNAVLPTLLTPEIGRAHV